MKFLSEMWYVATKNTRRMFLVGVIAVAVILAFKWSGVLPSWP
jgi:hypothetical protein